ncbi:TrmB family transcriptional regulator [Pseudogracilibacillus auburnensis]|uniref:Transcriptional regulator n=1 Tax=Pseudogracilibacillus auburnensis TaxID=1494959 RepID=A0A2V3WDX6_9BACI|nr:helix-turn-helix domain-containing protein [Pseudogracilibacillus auburnensis]MBO1002914.1 TrmB family transcriptional regulator [Pseudogracilibacillus auburnensis]PXW87009.1 transcriptional regulator [Pseudogracilibacillus auburnensis]
MERLIEQFEEIGFSKNEAKSYMALLKEPAINGYEISKKSGVPRSMVYSVIAKLLAKEAIIELRTEPPTYTPVPVKELIMNRKRQTEETLSFLEKELQVIEKPVEVNVIKHIEGRTKIIQAMQKLMKEANEEVWLSAWEEELEELRSSAVEQGKKGIQLYSLLFTNQETNSFGKTFYHRHDTASIEKRRMGQRLTIIIQDNQDVLIASFIERQIPQAIQTTEPMLVLLAKEYIRHDMMMKVVGDKVGKDMLNSLWQGDDLLTYIVRNVKK